MSKECGKKYGVEGSLYTYYCTGEEFLCSECQNQSPQDKSGSEAPISSGSDIETICPLGETKPDFKHAKEGDKLTGDLE